MPAWFATSGPSAKQVVEQAQAPAPGQSSIAVVDLTDAVARRVLAGQQGDSFAKALPVQVPSGYVVGAGDALEVSIWEAPPAALFGVAGTELRGAITGTRQTALPPQVVNADGLINVPFAGAVPVLGKSPQQIEQEVARRLSGLANQPQVLVRVLQNASHIVTVVGEVSASTRMPLTPKGERLLDAIASAGGVKQPVGKVTVQLSRAGRVLSMPLDAVIQDPQQNVYLQAGDVVTALFQPLSFTALGATGRNEEINFEAQGITLAQALGRMAGVRDAQADAKGVFIFRFEDPKVLAEGVSAKGSTPQGRVPVVYRVDLKDPATFLVAQNFPMKNKDVIYVANAPAAELQKFLNIVGSVLGPVIGVQTLINN